MSSSHALTLARGAVSATVIPSEGGVLSRLEVNGGSVLATTPWAGQVQGGGAASALESDWVERWRGGWQLCFPSAGAVDTDSAWPQAFHGVASQAPWMVLSRTDDEVVLEFTDEHGLGAARRWRLTDRGAAVSTTAINRGTEARPLVIAEHLILGGALLAPVMSGDAAFTIEPPAGTLIAALDYEGRPLGPRHPWPGAPDERWPRVDRETQARVAALVDVTPRQIRVDAAHASATVRWHGLDHALLWEELGRSSEAPWSHGVVALGIEPTTAPHGRGTALTDGTVRLEPNQLMTWDVDLAIDWHDAPSTSEERS